MDQADRDVKQGPPALLPFLDLQYTSGFKTRRRVAASGAAPPAAQARPPLLCFSRRRQVGLLADRTRRAADGVLKPLTEFLWF
jgi:hypothetical protein